MRWAALATAVAAVVVVLLVGGWIAGEMHYRNCIETAEARYPVAYRQGYIGEGQFGVSKEVKPEWQFVGSPTEREDALDSCSRSPW